MPAWTKTRIIFLMIFDCLLISGAVFLALLLRFEGDIPLQYQQAFISLLPWYTITTLVSLYVFRLYHRMWQYASIGELYGIVKSVTTSILVVVLCIYTIPLATLPRSVYILSWVFIILLIGASRLGWRAVRDLIIHDYNSVAKDTLIIGAGDAGAMVVRELQNNSSLGLRPVGLIDDSSLKQKLTLYGIPVLGNRKDIPRIVQSYGIEEIIIAMPSASGKTIREIIDICSTTEAKLRTFQGTDELLNGGYKLREIQLEDLLRRESVKLDLDEIAAYLTGKTVLVSGAGGSIGSELCRQICLHQPGRIILLDYSENNLFDIDCELRGRFPDLDLVAELTDIKDRPKLQQCFARYNPQVVFHAAAHKHVPMMELHPVEAVKNNVIGTRNVAEMADKHRVETFIFISTDKAVAPKNVMGATKRIAEMIVQEMNTRSSTRFAAVRFGNVLGSRGSVIPTFERQIKSGGPVTVTHPEMTRYFMTIPEAVQLVIQAGAMADGGEIFVLDMGEPVKILDLATDLMKLYGYEPGKDIKVEFIGPRPGEKLHEELFTANEEMAATRHDRIAVTQAHQQGQPVIIKLINDWWAVRKSGFTNQDVLELISTLLPGFPQESDDILIQNNDINIKSASASQVVSYL